MELEQLKQLKRLANAGAVIIAQRPVATLGLHEYQRNDAALQKITNQLWGKGKIRELSEFNKVLEKLKMKPDFEVEQDDVLYSYRRVNKDEVYFVSNQKQSTRQVSARFRVADKQPELWNPLTGETTNAPNWKALPDGRTEVQLELGPVDSMFIVFRNPTISKGKSTPPTKWCQVAPVAGPWTVSFDRMGPDTPIRLEKLMPLNEHTEEEVKYFSGLASYRNSFKLSRSAIKAGKTMKLDLGQVEVIANVRLNGVDLGSTWKPPYQVDITKAVKPGKNELEVSVATLMCNRLIGDEHYPDLLEYTQGSPKRMAAAITPKWLTEGSPLPKTTKRKTLSAFIHITKDDPLAPSGLIGPVVILVEDK